MEGERAIASELDRNECLLKLENHYAYFIAERLRKGRGYSSKQARNDAITRRYRRALDLIGSPGVSLERMMGEVREFHISAWGMCYGFD